MIKQLKSLLKFTKDLAGDLAAKRVLFEKIDEDGRLDRVETCIHCEHFKVREKLYTCDLCGCNLRIKTQFKISECPEDKWER